MLLDLDQQTLPGVAHQVVEQMVISDQIKAEDRANVLRALLLKHRWCRALPPAPSPCRPPSYSLPSTPPATRVTRRNSPSPEISLLAPWAPCWGITMARGPRVTPTSPSRSSVVFRKPDWMWSER